MPLYPTAVITKEESDLLIMQYIIRHNITDVGLEHILELINSHLPEPVLESKYKFLKNFPQITSIQSFYYCPDCNILLHFENTNVEKCSSCQQVHLRDSLKRNGHFFTYIPLRDQLSKLLSGPLFYQLRRDDNEELSDIISGRVYKMLREKNLISMNSISLQWNADGVQTFKSSKVSMCPIQVSINELEYRQRKENILLAGLWASSKKPVLDLFLKPFVEELQDLHDNGFQCLPPGFEEPITIKVHTILAPVDSVERCALQNIHQFNGEYGCSQCLHPGETIAIGNGHTRVYSNEKNGNSRTIRQHERDALKAETEKKVINGVKGMSILMLIPVFNIIRSFPPEYMHSMLLGVIKLFVSSWIDSSNAGERWYIGTKIRTLNDHLLTILPPCEITRVPQSLFNLKLWKASEYKNFAQYYSMPCLLNILEPIYYKHWSLFVYAINVFNSNKITNQDYETAAFAIKKFVENIELLYGKSFMKFNVHLLLHIPKAVRDFGALWAWSAFPYEDYNFTLRQMLHNSQSILQQICKSYLRYHTIKNKDTFEKANCSAYGKNLFLKMSTKSRKPTGSCRVILHNNQFVLYGTRKNVLLSLVEKLTIQAYLKETIQDNATYFDRFLLNNKTLYHSVTYEKLYKRNNSIIETKAGSFIEILKIVCVVTHNEITKYIVIGKSFEKIDEHLCVTGNISSSNYCSCVRKTNNIECCLPLDIVSKCILVPCTNEKSYIFRLINTQETD